MESDASGSTRIIEWWAWAEVNKKKLLIGAALVAAVIAAGAIYRSNRAQAEADAGAALLRLTRPETRSETAPGPNGQAFLQVATAHPGTSAAGQALLFAAEAFYREDKFAEAKTQFENFLRDYAENPVAPTAALGVAACLDAMDRTNEALTAYQDVLNRFAGSAVAAQAKLGLARHYEAKNDLRQALRLYDELLRPSVRSTWSTDAAIRREQLLTKHPELARTNAPAEVISSLLSSAPGTNLPLLTTTNPAPAAATNSK